VLIGPASLLSLLKVFYQREDETTRQKGPAQSFSTMNTHPNPNLNMRTTNSNNQEREEIPGGLQDVNLEDISIHFLCTYSAYPNWTQIISTRNDYGQTLAHIAVTLGFSRLLQHLSRWKIDLNIVDSMGLSALHYAYLFKQEECAKILIHSGVDRFILDELGRSPADLDPSLEVRLRSIMDMDMDSADGAPPIECDTGMPDEAGKLYAKQFLIQQWMREGEDEGKGEVPLSKCQSQETSGLPALDSADERVRGVTYERSSLGIYNPEKHSTHGVAEGIDLEASIETGAPPRFTYPPSPICEVSSRTQEVNGPPDTGQNSFSRPGPLGGATENTPDLEEDVKGQNDANDGGLLQRSNASPKSTSVAFPDSWRMMWRLPSAPYARPSARGQQPISGSSMEPADTVALYNIRKGEFVTDHPHFIEPCITILGAYNARQTDTSSPSSLTTVSQPASTFVSTTYPPPPGTPPVTQNTRLTPVSASTRGNPLSSSADASRDRVLGTLGTWLRDRLTADEPVIGLDCPLEADLLGIKGMTVLTAFFDHSNMEKYTCYVCSHVSSNLSGAINHQRIARHYQG